MWRLRAIIETEVELIPEIAETNGEKYRIFEINDKNTKGGNSVPPNIRYCDVIGSGSTSDIVEAYSSLYDKLNKFLDRISLVSYGKAVYRTILSVTPVSVRHNESFEIAIPQFMLKRETKKVGLNSLNLGEMVGDNLLRFQRLLRLGLNSNSEEEKYISFFSLLEEIARAESTEYIENECPKCQHKVDTGRKKTNNYILAMLKGQGVEKKLTGKAVDIRNKIAHGGAVKNKEFYSTLSLLNSHIEEVCLLELEKRLDITINNRLNVHITEVPVVTHKCTCKTDGTFELVETNQRIPARFVKLKHDDDEIYKNTKALVGLPLDSEQRPFIDPMSWPEVVK